jgi:hypothetical protein
MRVFRGSIAVCLAILMTAPALRAQDHVITASALSKAVQQRVAQDQSDRDAILSLLRRAEVRQMAARVGLSLEKAEAAVTTLQGDDLRQIAGEARAAEQDLVGGASVTISTTVIIIALLIVILIIVAVD